MQRTKQTALRALLWTALSLTVGPAGLAQTDQSVVLPLQAPYGELQGAASTPETWVGDKKVAVVLIDFLDVTYPQGEGLVEIKKRIRNALFYDATSIRATSSTPRPTISSSSRTARRASPLAPRGRRRLLSER